MLARGRLTRSVGAFALVVSPRRTTGVAPFNVHFDATGTLSANVPDTFRNVWYEWNFGESSGPGVAAWTFGIQNRTRNTAHGPIAGHLYETPGTYMVTCSATDGINSAVWTTLITVQDPAVVYAGKTMQYSNAGSGSSTQVITSSHETILATIASKGDGWRHRFNRGDTFLMSTDPSESVNNIHNSDLLLDAYGSGAAPVFGLTGASASSANSRGLFTFGQQANVPTRCTLSDVLVDGTTSTADRECEAVTLFAGIDLTLVRVTAKTCQMVLRCSVLQDKYNFNLGGMAMTLNPGLAVYDCAVQSPKDTTSGNPPYALYFAAEKYIVQGCNFDLNAGANDNRTHALRQTHGYKGLVANNLLRGAGQNRHCLKIHSETQADVENVYFSFTSQPWLGSVYGPNGPSGGKTDYIWCCDNQVESTFTTVPVASGPPSSGAGDDTGTRIYHLGIVGNLIKSGALGGFQVGVGFWAQSGIVANNVFSITTGAASRHCAIHVGTRSEITGQADGPAVLPGQDVIVENNSAYIAPSNAGIALMLAIQPNALSVTSRNNVLWSPNDATSTYSSGSTLGAGVAITAVGYTSSHDSTNAQARQAGTPFASSAPATLANFTPAGGSYCLNAGVYNGLQRDIAGTVRSLVTPDMGAVEV